MCANADDAGADEGWGDEEDEAKTAGVTKRAARVRSIWGVNVLLHVRSAR